MTAGETSYMIMESFKEEVGPGIISWKIGWAYPKRRGVEKKEKED